ncbi:hypothetical protein M3Y99_00616000 [Aphelenchoides fujianensis]|nr:hypothetical protein M3Y99_00616000 [Aphelenchoides fujianensis]
MPWLQKLDQKEKLRDRDEYMRRTYGDPFGELWNNNERPQFMTEREFWENQHDSTKSNGIDERTNSATDSTRVRTPPASWRPASSTPKSLSYEQYLQWHLRRFCYKTSAHGIPQIGQAPNRYYRGVWITLFSLCMIALYYNATSVIEKYNRNEKIVDIELKFDTAPFPAITLCNLNPYKASLTKDLSAFDGAMNKAGVVDEQRSERIKRLVERDLNHSSVFEPGFSKCQCEDLREEVGETDDVAEGKGRVSRRSLQVGSAYGDGREMYVRFRPKHERRVAVLQVGGVDPTEVCFVRCPSILQEIRSTMQRRQPTVSPAFVPPPGDFCMAYDGESPILEIWKYLNGDPEEEEAQFVEAMGFTGMTDEVAIVTKAKENLIFAMSALSMQGADAALEQQAGAASQVDFLTHVDPIFGSCYTYNHNRNVTLGSVRAGPMYGLRMLVYVNASEYMPTTEATGVRLTIHDKEEFPFPARFPVPPGRHHCRASDAVARKCLDEKFNELGGHQGSMSCKCQQPCSQSVYSVTYSPARWPSKSLQIQIGTCNSTPAECTLHYKSPQNGAMIEVFYEQLNFELLSESEAYGLVNLLADFGGQLGLWCGISFLTCCELVFLILEMAYISVEHRLLLYRQKHPEKYNKQSDR